MEDNSLFRVPISLDSVDKEKSLFDLYQDLYQACNEHENWLAQVKADKKVAFREASHFVPMVGRAYYDAMIKGNNSKLNSANKPIRLMVVGRSVNGWYSLLEDHISNEHLSEEINETIFAEEAEKFFEKYSVASWLKIEERKALRDIERLKGVNGRLTEYHIRKSHFWNIIGKITGELRTELLLTDSTLTENSLCAFLTGQDPVQENDLCLAKWARAYKDYDYSFCDLVKEFLWLETLVWTNLYKVAPPLKGNPNTDQKKLQAKCCLDILEAKIKLLKPTHILFITGYDFFKEWLSFALWQNEDTDYFKGLEDLQVRNVVRKQGEKRQGGIEYSKDIYVEAEGRLSYDSGEALVLIACRPEGRKHEPYKNAILEGFKKPNNL